MGELGDSRKPIKLAFAAIAVIFLFLGLILFTGNKVLKKDVIAPTPTATPSATPSPTTLPINPNKFIFTPTPQPVIINNNPSQSQGTQNSVPSNPTPQNPPAPTQAPSPTSTPLVCVLNICI